MRQRSMTLEAFGGEQHRAVMLRRQAAMMALAGDHRRSMRAAHQRAMMNSRGETRYCRNRQKSGDGPLNHCGLQHNFSPWLWFPRDTARAIEVLSDLAGLKDEE